MQANRFRSSALALALAGAFALGVGLADRVTLHPASAATTAAPAVAATPVAPYAATAVPAAALPDFSGLVEKYGPAVVNISVVQGTKTAAHMPRFQMPDEEDLPQFFRNLPFQFQMPEPQERGPVRGVGSGFIVGADGIILTNAHVVDDADEVTVKLTDKREFTAKVLGVDKTTDIAVLKIAAHNLPYVRIGDPKATKVGEWVVAIGQPFGFENTVTAGIVSAKSRSLPGDSYVPFIQTDAAVNPGNSGGPLFNLRGEVIGVNSQIFSRSGGFQGLAFAVPIDVAMQVKDEIQQNWQGRSRPARRVDPGGQPGAGAELRPEVALRRPGRRGRERQPRGKGRGGAGRRDSQARRQGDIAFFGPATDGVVAQAGSEGDARRLAQRLGERTHGHGRRDQGPDRRQRRRQGVAGKGQAWHRRAALERR